LSELVLNEVERMIAEEYPTAGCRLPNEAELGDRFHVSRIVIREAMKILEDRGVVEVRAGRGTVTAEGKPDRVKASLLRLFQNQPIPTIAGVERLLELRQVLEETTASLAAVRATEEDLAEIRAALNGMQQDNLNLHEAAAADLRFHLAVMHAAHNPYLEMVLHPLMEVFLQQIKLTSLQAGYELHHKIFLDIQSRNPVAARQSVRRLMKRTLADCRNALKTLA
jgi:DNA-binding FadR family transcriptional regulator